MHRVRLQRLGLVAMSVARLGRIQPFLHSRIQQRNLSFLPEKSEYLRKLLDDSGFRNLKCALNGLPEGGAKDAGVGKPGKDLPSILQQNQQILEADWMIDRSNAHISCTLKLSNKSDNPESAHLVTIEAAYPEYGPKASPPIIPALVDTHTPKAERIRQFMNSMWRTFCVNDLLKLNVKATMDSSGKLQVSECDAIVDECAIHRQPEVFKHVVRNDLPVEIEAEKHLLVYRKFPGNGRIGTIVNGAGLAMSTCDTIDLLHGKSSNFLDAGGKATPETIKEAFRIVLKDEKVNTIIVNVFGGVIQGDMIATGILTAMKDLQLTLPVVARIQGTNGSLGMKMLRDSGFKNLFPHENLYDAVNTAVKLSARKHMSKGDTRSQDARLAGWSKPFPNVYTLVHTSPAYRTSYGRIRPAVETYAIKGQANRRVRLARSFRRGDPSLDIPRIGLGKAKKLVDERRLVEYVNNREKLIAERIALKKGIDVRVEGPGAAFFNERNSL